MTVDAVVGTPPGSVGYYTDGSPRIRLGSWFYSNGGFNPGTWQTVGAQVFIPAGAGDLIGQTVRFSLLHRLTADTALAVPFNFNDTPARTVDVVCTGTGWVSGTWPTPLTFTDNQSLFVFYEWLGAAAGTYLFETGSDFPADAVGSSTLAGMFLAEAAFNRSYFAQSATDGTPGNFNAWYGVDVLIDAGGAAPPNQGAADLDWTADLAVSGGHRSAGAADLETAWDLAVAGETAHRGSVTLAGSYDVAASGRTDHRGTATPDHAWTVDVAGHMPAVDAATGAATVPYSYELTAAGRAAHRGSTATAANWALSVAGQQPRQAGQTSIARLGDDTHTGRLAADSTIARLGS